MFFAIYFNSGESSSDLNLKTNNTIQPYGALCLILAIRDPFLDYVTRMKNDY